MVTTRVQSDTGVSDTVRTMNKLTPFPLIAASCVLIVTCDGQSRQLSHVAEGMFGQFREVTFQSVWEQVQSRKTVSFSVVRDTSQFLVINIAWITAGLLLWRGPAVTRAEETEEDEVDISRLNNFFTNPTVVARNLFVCTSLVNIKRLVGRLLTLPSSS